METKNIIVKSAKDLFDPKVKYEQKIITAIIYIIVILVSIWGTLALYKLIKKKIFYNRYGDKPEYRLATEIQLALNPSGVGWMETFDTTDKDALYEAAKKIKKSTEFDFDDVASAYNMAYSKGMASDIQKELSSKEYQTFLFYAGLESEKPKGAIEPMSVKLTLTEAKEFAKELKKDIFGIQLGLLGVAIRSKDLYIELAQMDAASFNRVLQYYYLDTGNLLSDDIAGEYGLGEIGEDLVHTAMLYEDRLRKQGVFKKLDAKR